MYNLHFLQDNIQILRDLSLLQIQMRDLEGYRVGSILISLVTLYAPVSLSVCKFFLHYTHRICCLVMRTKQMIIQSSLSKMKNKILPTCSQGNYRGTLGDFSNLSHGVFGAQRFICSTND